MSDIIDHIRPLVWQYMEVSDVFVPDHMMTLEVGQHTPYLGIAVSHLSYLSPFYSLASDGMMFTAPQRRASQGL